MKIAYYILISFFGTTLVSCNRDILEEKPDKSLVVPATLADYEALLNNTTFVFGTDRKGMMEVLCGDHYVNLKDVLSASISLRNGYTWQPDIYGEEISDEDWFVSYRQVYNANVVLDGLEELDKNVQESMAFGNVKGTALFFRANAFWTLTQLYTKPYVKESASTELGIPLRLSADFNQVSVRSNLQETYLQILDDLLKATGLLPVQQAYKTQPNKAAAWALLARTALCMNDYERAMDYAEQCLSASHQLLDFNELNAAARFPIPDMNDEVIFRSTLTNYGALFSVGVCKMDATLINAYHEDDVRKSIFYVQNADGTYSFKGHYTGSLVPFSGITVAEVLLIKAECLARRGRLDEAQEQLKTLLIHRFKNNKMEKVPYESKEELLAQILLERRKELVFRGIRWSDLRRLNLDPAFAIKLTRRIDGEEYELPPNDPRYTLLIHPATIEMTGMQQNAR
ncbi:RagB/SusD family nutrient uptake outer membrane protein [Olivibacter domesticus]|uniref:SusD family protein n=1 Tax=Olivibacter domesticus TaxID=407022 RepID=A0A1H7WN45_OLID1|nr:RagB/SusD family nutrient uptake outer membrane protein [Olivibacter domesticus]SEM22933.1 SusD family protein [Olivibacter domesticus]